MRVFIATEPWHELQQHNPVLDEVRNGFVSLVSIGMPLNADGTGARRMGTP